MVARPSTGLEHGLGPFDWDGPANRGDPNAKGDNPMHTSPTLNSLFELTTFSRHPSGASLPEQHY
jgi:hypothetical protein